METEQGSVFAVADARRLWLVGLLVSVARWLEMLVIGILVWQATGSAFLVAAMVLLRLLPMGMFGALLGVAADRVQRRSALLLVVAGQAAVAAALAVLAFTGSVEVWKVAVACFFGGLAWASDNPVRRMLIGEVVGPARLGTAMSVDVMANNASRIAGPAVGGTVLAWLGAGPAFLLGLLLYLTALGAAFGIRHRSRVSRARRPVLAETAESFGLVLRSPQLRGVIVVTLIFNVFGWPCTSMVPVIGQEALRLDPSGVGVLAAMDGLGALLGGLLLGWLGPAPVRYARIYVVGTAACMSMLALFAVLPHPALAGLALLLSGVGGAGFATMQATLVYLIAPPELRSRALGVLSVFIGLGLVGFLLLGIAANLVGAPVAVAGSGAAGLLALALTRPTWRRIRPREAG